MFIGLCAPTFVTKWLEKLMSAQDLNKFVTSESSWNNLTSRLVFLAVTLISLPASKIVFALEIGLANTIFALGRSRHWPTVASRCRRSNCFDNQIRFRSSSVKMSTPTRDLTTYATFPDFLYSTFKNIRDLDVSHQDSKFNVILGNEAGDADSIISSLALGYVESIYNKQNSSITVPLVSIPREDMILRRDVTVLLEKCGIDWHSLLYMDDPVVKKILSLTDQLSITLVDHNKLQASLYCTLESRVTGIYDHHHDEGEHMLSCPVGPERHVAFENDNFMVGSTVTLLVERIQSLSLPTKIEGSLGLALLSVIVLDTMNMDPNVKRGTPRDKAAIDYLRLHTQWPNDEVPDTHYLFQWLQGCKFDPQFWKSLSVMDSLRLDYKRFQQAASSSSSSSFESSEDGESERLAFGISAILLPLKDFVSKSNLYEQINDFIHVHHIQYLVVMNMIIQDDAPPRRELLVATSANSNQLAQRLDQFLQKDDLTSMLQLQPMDLREFIRSPDINNGVSIKAYAQGNTMASRKQVAPILMRFDMTSSRASL